MYELNGRKITKDIDRSAAYDASRDTVYIIDEKAQNRYSALFQIKDVLSKHLTTLKGIDEILSNCFDRPIEYVTEFLLSKGIETIEEPFKDITTSVSLITAKDTLTSQQISETPTEINATTLPSESDKLITEIEEKLYTTHSTEEESEHVIDQIPEIPSQREVRADSMLAEKAESSEKEEYLIQEGSFDQKPIETIESSKQKSDLTKIDKDAGTFNIFQEVEEKSHEKWKPEYEPSKVDIDKILVTYIKPTEEFDESPKKEIKLIESLSIKLESEGFTGLSPSKRYNTLSEEGEKRIGHIGEKLVFLYLKKSLLKKYGDAKIEELNDGSKIVLKRHGQILAEIYWLNHKEDAMKEYDIKLVEKGREKYIEVKSTVGDKNYFEISPNQWKFAASHGNSYYIYMVCKIGTRIPELLILENLHKLWKEGKLEIAADSLRVIISKEIKEKHLRT